MPGIELKLFCQLAVQFAQPTDTLTQRHVRLPNLLFQLRPRRDRLQSFRVLLEIIFGQRLAELEILRVTPRLHLGSDRKEFLINFLLNICVNLFQQLDSLQFIRRVQLDQRHRGARQFGMVRQQFRQALPKSVGLFHGVAGPKIQS